MLRLFSAIVIFSLLLSLSLPATAGPAGPAASYTATVVGTPLPLTCSGNPVPSACLYGYVYYDGAPVIGAVVTIESPFGESVVTSTVGAASGSPYFQAKLNGPPLLISVGGTITLTTNYSGSSASLTYVTIAGGQQADLVIRSSTLFGNGSDGPLTISSNTTEAPIDAVASGTIGSHTLSATNPLFMPGQLILIHQTQGTNAGTWMRNRIAAYTAGTISLTDALNTTYTAGAQVRVLKQYTNVTINSGVTYTPKAWNGTVGGILAFMANGTIDISGTISANASGFRGGNGAAPNASFLDGDTGEGTTGPSISQSTAANGNGGGGGGHSLAGGGGGGNGTSGSNSNPQPQSNVGLGGATSGSADLTTMTFGGGGGGGGESDNYPAGNGGAGGGIVFLAGATLTVAGSVSSTGADGQAMGAGQHGGGGAGAGGSILYKAQSATLGTSLVTAPGGAGGTVASNPNLGTGGNGGDGRIHLDYYLAYTGATTPAQTTQPIPCTASPIPTINSINPVVAIQTQDTVHFTGMATSADMCGTTITAYVWRSDLVVLSTETSFTRTAASLPVGSFPIYFKARDSNNVWSEEISRTITIQSNSTPTPTPGTPAGMFLPLVIRSFGPFEAEPNNSLAQANGPLASGVDYHGYQNDASDYFSFFAAAGNISVNLSNTSAPGTQLYLYYQDNSHLVGHDGHIGSPPYHIDYTGTAGLYYARITAGAPFNISTQYFLRVTYP